MNEWSHASAVVAAWLKGAETVAPSLPSWLAPRQAAEEPGTLASLDVALQPIANVGPPAMSRLMPSLPPLASPRISVHETPPPPYPDLREENAGLRKQIAEMAIAMARLRREVLEASEGELVTLAMAIGERIARHELRIDPKLVLGWVREAIDLSATKDSVVIAIAPDLAAALSGTDWEGMGVGPARVETDASLRPFQCEVRAGASAVEVNVDERVAAMSRELGVPAA
jgi:hypothetical protein